MSEIAKLDRMTGPWSQRLLAAEREWLSRTHSLMGRLVWIQGHALTEAHPQADLNGLRMVASPDGWRLGGDLILKADEWPIQSDCIDAMVIQHPMESGAHLLEWLPEVVRVLKPESSIWIFSSRGASTARRRLVPSPAGFAELLRHARVQELRRSLHTLGCVDIRHDGLKFDGVDCLRHRGSARIWHGLTLIHARKRRSAMVHRPKALQGLVAPPVNAIGGLPASRVGLAA